MKNNTLTEVKTYQVSHIEQINCWSLPDMVRSIVQTLTVNNTGGKTES